MVAIRRTPRQLEFADDLALPVRAPLSSSGPLFSMIIRSFYLFLDLAIRVGVVGFDLVGRDDGFGIFFRAKLADEKAFPPAAAISRR